MKRKVKTKLTKFFVDPTKDPTFKATQAQWYAKLATETDFKDIEAAEEHPITGHRPLKSWTGDTSTTVEHKGKLLDLVDVVKTQPSLQPIVSSFPEGLLNQQEQFLHHPEFTKVCEALTKHGNSKLTPQMILGIWEAYVAGASYREIGRQFGIHNSTVEQIISKVSSWMDVLETRSNMPDPTFPQTTTVILRPYNPSADAACVFSTWRNSLWYDKQRDPSHSDQFFKLASREITKLLALPTTKVNIACLSDDPNQIVGYSVLSSSTLEWIYVKAPYRKQGVGSLLAKGFTDIAYPTTKIGASIAKNHNLTIKENTYGPDEADKTDKV